MSDLFCKKWLVWDEYKEVELYDDIKPTLGKSIEDAAMRYIKNNFNRIAIIGELIIEGLNIYVVPNDDRKKKPVRVRLFGEDIIHLHPELIKERINLITPESTRR